MKVVVYDIETGSTNDVHSASYEFFRRGGWAEVDTETGEVSETRRTSDGRELTGVLMNAQAISGHNIINYDNMVMAKWAGADYEALCRKSFDTLPVEYHLDPIAAKGAQPNGYYKLGATSMRHGGPDKVDEIDRLARKHKGYHLIPQDDPEYNEYLDGDVGASVHLFKAQSRAVAALPREDQAYIRREHAVAAAMGRITLEGFRVDVDECMRRWSAGQARLEAGKMRMHERYGMPLTGTYPHRSNPGKAAFRAAILDTGISEAALDANWPKAKDGSLRTGKEVLNEMIEVLDKPKPAAAELCRIVLAMNGERSVYGTILDHLVGDRVYPYIGPDQGSGRWSMKRPGLTVLGKRGGKAVERGVLLADSDDELLCAIDADQVDARMVAGMCQDREYLKLFEPGRDLHSEVALRVFNNPACRTEMARNNGRCDCELRDRAKVFGHGFSYGLGANGMAAQHGVDVTVAQEFVAGMTAAFPQLHAWKEETRALAGALPYGTDAPDDDSYRILKTAFGRTVRVERNRAYTQATAMMGQGSTRDAMAHAILNLPADVRRRVRAVIHDEIVISLPKEAAQESAQKIADSMAFDFRGVPITFGCSRVSRSWAGVYGEKYETAA